MAISNRKNPETAYVTSSYNHKYNNQKKRKLPDEDGESEGNFSGKESKGEFYFCKKPVHWKNAFPLLSEAAKHQQKQKIN